MVSLVNSKVTNSNDSAAETRRPVSDSHFYNLGHAPFEVIQKFQEFCCSYKSLTEALLEILSREPLLKRKYHFIITPVMYQMLARPTHVDSENILEATIEVLKKFTRRGRYDSMSNAIEELLFSPMQGTESLCDKATWTCGNIGNNYTELSQGEQDVLEKIADTLIYRISTMTPAPKKRKYRPKKDSPSKKHKGNETTPTVSSKKYGQTQALVVKKDSSKVASSHLCLNSLHHTSGDVQRNEPPDAELAIPMKNFLKKECPTANDNAIPGFSSSEHPEFLLNFLELLPVRK